MTVHAEILFTIAQDKNAPSTIIGSPLDAVRALPGVRLADDTLEPSDEHRAVLDVEDLAGLKELIYRINAMPNLSVRAVRIAGPR